MYEVSEVDDRPLRRNRDFNLLWVGQVVSDLGANVSGIAFPLLVLATTGSPARAGIVASAAHLPLLVLTLPAGALVDRWGQKRVLLVADSARCLALGSLPLTIALDALTFVQIVVVALVEGAGYVFFGTAEGSALTRVVADRHLSAALARNSMRAHTAALAGQPLGGVLFGIGRVVPFLFDAVSYLVSVLTVSFIRTTFRRERTSAGRTRLLGDMRAGLDWFWRQPFFRAASLIALGRSFAVSALYLVVIVVARERGASPALIGAMFVFLGVSGILGSFVAPWLSRRLRMRTVVIATTWTGAALVPLLIIVPGRVAPGVIYAAMYFLHPAWSASVGAYRLRQTPLELQGRVTSLTTLIAGGPVPLALLGTGFLLEGAGSTPTVLLLSGVMIVVAAAAVLSRAIKDAPATLPHGARLDGSPAAS